MAINRSDTNLGEKRTNAWASGTTGHEPRSEKSADGQLRTAVLLDPDPISLEAIEQVLRRLDITVVGKAAFPKRALALVDERKPDLLIVDIETGDSEIDGIESLRRAREHVPQLTTIALCPSNDPERVAAAFDAGASAFVWKRTQSDDFVTAIRQLFEKSIFFAGDRPSPGTNREERPLSTASQRQGAARRRRSATPNVVVLAGGRGARLAPYTSILPKPLMPIGDRPILEIIIDQLAAQRFTDVTLCVGYLSHLIRSVLDDRVGEGITLRYVQEGDALGTAGPLRLIESIDRTFVVMNGDVLTTLDYRALVRRHRESGDALTIATSKRTTTMDYGVLHMDGPSLHPRVRRVTAYEEKPEVASMVSMGIYVLEPRALDYIPEGAYFDFPDLVQALLGAGEQVGSYLYDGMWFDIGRREDYELAVEAWTNGNANGQGAKRAPRRRVAKKRTGDGG